MAALANLRSRDELVGGAELNSFTLLIPREDYCLATKKERLIEGYSSDWRQSRTSFLGLQGLHRHLHFKTFERFSVFLFLIIRILMMR